MATTRQATMSQPSDQRACRGFRGAMSSSVARDASLAEVFTAALARAWTAHDALESDDPKRTHSDGHLLGSTSAEQPRWLGEKPGLQEGGGQGFRAADGIYATRATRCDRRQHG